MASAISQTRVVTSEFTLKKKRPQPTRPTISCRAGNPAFVTNGKSFSSASKNGKHLKKAKINVGDRKYYHSLTRYLRSLVDSGSLEAALQLFDSISHLDSFVWNVMIKGLVEYEMYEKAIEFYYMMQMDGFRHDHFTYPFVIKACTELRLLGEGLKIHSKLVKNGLAADVYVSNTLISLYAKMEYITYAQIVFEEMDIKDLVSWNSMISGYILVGDALKSLEYVRNMQAAKMVPDRFTYISSLRACSLKGFLRSGKEVHSMILRNGFETDIMIQTSIINMYCNSGRVDTAENFFDSMPHKCLAAWNALIAGYSLCSLPYDSLTCMRTMQQTDKLAPDSITLINVLPACAQLEALLLVRSIHSFSIRKGFLPHGILNTSLIDTYGACGKVYMAEFIFRQMHEKNLTSWNAMIKAYMKNERYKEAMNLFEELIWQVNLKPDSVTIATILPTFTQLGSLAYGKQLHGYLTRLDFSSNTHISNALVCMYAKCGDLSISRIIFERTSVKDVVSWNTIIMANALHGFAEESLQLFSLMKETGIMPNHSSFASLLSSCSLSGRVDEGWNYFEKMKREYGIDPGIEHYGCMLDLLGRSGKLDQMRALIEEMPLVPTARIWGSLLVASINNKNIEMAEFAANHIFSIDHDNTGCHVLLSSMYAECERWADVERIGEMMKNKRLEKIKGYSTVERCGSMHVFFDQDQSHAESRKIYETLEILHKRIKEEPYVDTLTKYRPGEQAKKGKIAEFHSVRLAIAFGLISTRVGDPVLVRKNLKICKDCHEFAKKISMFTRREIVVGDSKMFHHFRSGSCCCGDYW